MSKSLYPEVAKMLGVEIGEEFKITDKLADDYVFRIVESGLECKPSNTDYWRVGDFTLRRLDHLLYGLTHAAKMPFEPKYGDVYWTPRVKNSSVAMDTWKDTTYDYALLALGMVYRTKEEAEAHLAEDYKKLTGKELENE